MKKIRLWWQIFITSIITSVIALFAVTWYASSVGRAFYLDKISESLQIRAELITALLKNSVMSGADADSLQREIQKIGDNTGTRITIIFPDGRVYADSEKDPRKMDNHSQRPEVLDAVSDKIGSSIRFSETLKKHLMYVAIPFFENGQLKAVIRTAKDIEIIEDTLADMQQKIIISGIIIAIFTVIISLFVSRKITNPFELIIGGVEKFTDGDFKTRFPEPPTIEMSKLVAALNKMAVQIDDKIQTIVRQKNQQKAVFESMAEGVVAIDKNEKIISINKAAINLLGLDFNRYYTEKITEIVVNRQLKNLIIGALKSDLQQEAEIVYKSPEEQYLKVQVNTLKDEQGETIGALIVLNDVTRLRHLESGRREFVANVSHEIRTPLTSIKGFVEALQEGAINEKENTYKFLDIISRQTNRLNTILEDLLTLSRLEREGEHDEIRFVKSNLYRTIDSAVQICKHNADKKKITLDIKCPDTIEVRMNSPLIEEAIINLVDNAIKYSPNEKHVDIVCSENGNEVNIKVKDQGNGISKEHLPRIFERFYRVDKARSRKIGGTGLGLAIVKHIAMVHGGRVDVESEVGKGSCFNLWIPSLN